MMQACGSLARIARILRAQVVNLRRVLGGGGDCPWIVNVAGQGYCFTAPVRRPETLYGIEDGWRQEALSA